MVEIGYIQYDISLYVHLLWYSFISNNLWKFALLKLWLNRVNNTVKFTLFGIECEPQFWNQKPIQF